ncbi:MAG: hypothetical protein RL398_1847, partial [Planctomycetota bacterium]
VDGADAAETESKNREPEIVGVDYSEARVRLMGA